MAQPKELQSPMAQGPSSIPSADVSGETDMMNSLANTPRMPASQGAPMPTPAPTQAPQQDQLSFMDTSDPLAFMDSAPTPAQGAQLTPPPKPAHVTYGDQIVRAFKENLPEIAGATILDTMAAPLAVAAGPWAPAVLAGAGGLGATMGRQAVDIYDTAKTALPMMLDRGKEFVDKLVDGLKGDKAKMYQAYDWFKNSLNDLPQGIAQTIQQTPEELNKVGARLLGNTTAMMGAHAVTSSLARYGAQKFAADMGTTVQDLEASLSNYNQLNAIATKLGIGEIPPGLEGAGMVEGPLTAAAAKNQKMWRTAATGGYGTKAQEVASKVLREIQGQVNTAFESTLGEFAKANAGVAPDKALKYHMGIEAEGEKAIRGSLMDEYGDKYTPADPLRLKAIMDEPVRMFLDDNGMVPPEYEARMSPDQRQWMQARELYLRKMQKYFPGMSEGGTLTLRELGTQNSQFQGTSPVGRVLDPLNKTAELPPGVDIQTVRAPTGKGGYANVSIPTMPDVTASELNLPTQTTAGQSPVGGTPTRNLTLRELDQMLNDFQDVVYGGKGVSDQKLKQAAAKLRIEFNDSLTRQLPANDPRVGWLQDSNASYSSWVDHFSQMNDTIQKFPQDATQILVPPKNTPDAELRTKLVFEHLEKESQDQIRKGFLQNIKEQASSDKGRVDPNRVKSLLDQYTPNQIDMVFGRKGASNDLNALVNMARVVEKAQPPVTGAVETKALNPVIRGTLKLVQGLAHGTKAAFTGELVDMIDRMVVRGRPFEKTIQGMNYKAQIMKALGEAPTGVKNSAPVRATVGQGLKRSTGLGSGE